MAAACGKIWGYFGDLNPFKDSGHYSRQLIRLSGEKLSLLVHERVMDVILVKVCDRLTSKQNFCCTKYVKSILTFIRTGKRTCRRILAVVSQSEFLF